MDIPLIAHCLLCKESSIHPRPVSEREEWSNYAVDIEGGEVDGPINLARQIINYSRSS